MKDYFFVQSIQNSVSKVMFKPVTIETSYFEYPEHSYGIKHPHCDVTKQRCALCDYTITIAVE